MMKNNDPVKKKEEKKPIVDSDEELWKQASQIAADEEEVKSEDENLEETQPETPSFDDIPSPVVQSLVQQLERDDDDDDDDDTPMMIPEADRGEIAEHSDENPDDGDQDKPEGKPATAVVRSKIPGENTFSFDCVKTWSPARIHAWEIRRVVSWS
jgi:hypothetical protein